MWLGRIPREICSLKERLLAGFMSLAVHYGGSILFCALLLVQWMLRPPCAEMLQSLSFFNEAKWTASLSSGVEGCMCVPPPSPRCRGCGLQSCLYPSCSVSLLNITVSALPLPLFSPLNQWLTTTRVPWELVRCAVGNVPTSLNRSKKYDLVAANTIQQCHGPKHT